MTKTTLAKPDRKSRYLGFRRFVEILLLISAVFLLIKYSSVVTAGAISGITLAVRSIIPALFPFLILSDVFVYTLDGETGVFGRIFSKIFGISPYGAIAFLCGCFSGFPVGVKCAADLYSQGKIGKDDFERIIGFVNNPSPAFVIAAVGGMRGNTEEGVILYISTLLAAVIVGILFSKRGKKTKICKLKYAKTHFSLASSIKNAAYTSVGISAYIIFFSVLLSVIKAVFASGEITIIASLFLEVGNAASLLASSSFHYTVSLTLTAFALGFSGLSVLMQAKSLLPDGVSMRKYAVMKLLQGVFSVLTVLLISRLLSL